MPETVTLFPEEFIGALSDDPWEAVASICDKFVTWYKALPKDDHLKHHDTMVDAYALLRVVVSQRAPNLVNIPEAHPIGHDQQANINGISGQFRSIHGTAREFLDRRSASHHFNVATERYEALLAGELRIEFTDNEIGHLQRLINELRTAITKCPSLEASHRSRLLRRLERLQQELHKKVSDLDRMWMFIGDAAFVLGRAAEDAKPIFDRIREMMGITREAMARANGLLGGALPNFFLEDKASVAAPDTRASANRERPTSSLTESAKA